MTAKCIYHNASGIDEPDDLSYPYRVDIFLSPPEFMNMAFIGMVGGSEQVSVISPTKEEMEEFLSANQLRNHPRLLSLEEDERPPTNPGE